jgi:hypothetical protein
LVLVMVLFGAVLGKFLVVEGMGEQGFWRERSYGDVPLGLDVGCCFLSLRDPGNELPGLPFK